jgi:DNA ligase-1
MNLPRLFKKTSTGAIQQWEIDVSGTSHRAYVNTIYGQVGTDSPQATTDEITEGKNVGRANETSPFEQAVAEAKAKHEKQRKKGYVDSIEAAQSGELDDLIEGGNLPMLAHHYMDVIYDLRKGHEGKVTYKLTKDSKKIKFPCGGQRKLDGIRCTAEFDSKGSCTLWSRTRKQILSCPHIQREVERLFKGAPAGIVIDGELYNHKYKGDFEKIVSAVRQDEPSPESELVQYHVYDCILPGTFSHRDEFLSNYPDSSDLIVKVETVEVSNADQVVPLMEKFVLEGYEGLILRNTNGLYVGKRSYDLQKAKPFQDDEFEIVGFEEGRGKLAGHLGAWVCKTKSGATFNPPMNRDQDKLQEYFENGESYIGELLTVRFQGYTGKNKVPRFPKGHSIRNYE